MAAAAQRIDAFARARDRLLLRAEILAVERVVPALHGARLDRSPRTRLSHPGAVAAERVDAHLGAPAAHALEAHVLHARGAAGDERVAHHAVGADAERGGV